MSLTLFDLPTWDRIFSYQSHAYIYQHIRHVNKHMQKAAMIELVSRRKNATDIFYQEKLFTEIKFIPSYLKVDKLFQKTLWAQVIASIDSQFSTPQHRHLSWIFLSLFHELPFKFLSDRHLVDLILLWRLRETLYIDYDDSDSKRLLALLPSKQVSYFVTNPVANRLQLTDILGLIANRPISPEIEAFIDGFVQTLPVPIPIWDREKLGILQKIYCHMNSEQRKTIINKCFESIKLNSHDFRFDFQIVALSAIYANEEHAYDIFHGMIMIVLSDNFQTIIDNGYHNIMVMLRSLAHKLKSTTELLDLMLNTYHKLMHTQMLFCEILYLLGTTSQEAADRVFMRIYAERYRSDFKDKLNKLTTKLSNNYAQELIKTYLPHIALTIQNKNGCITFESQALEILKVLSPRLHQKEASQIFEKLILILQCKDRNQIFAAYSYALRALKKMASYLSSHEKETAIQILFDILDDSSAKSEHSYVFEAFTSLIPSLNSTQLDNIFIKIINLLNGDKWEYTVIRAVITQLINLKSYMNDTRVNQLIQSIQALNGKDIDNRLCEHLLYLMEEFSSKFSVEQIRSVFPVILNMGSFTERTLKLKWCLSIKEHLHECDVDLLLEKILLMNGYNEFNKASDEIVCLISIHIENKLSDEQKLSVLIRVLSIFKQDSISHPRYALLRAIATDTASTLASKLAHSQVADLWSQIMQTNQIDARNYFIPLKILASMLDSIQINEALIFILDAMRFQNEAGDVNDFDSVVDISWIREGLDVLTHFISKLNSQQIENTCYTIRDLLFSNITLWNRNDVATAVSTFFHTLILNEVCSVEKIQSLLLPTNETTNISEYMQDLFENKLESVETLHLIESKLMLMEIFLCLANMEKTHMMLTQAHLEQNHSPSISNR